MSHSFASAKKTHAISLPSLCFIFMWAQRWKEFLIWSKFIDQFNSTVLDFGRASKNSFLTTAHCIHFLAGKCMNLSVSNHNMWSRVSFFIEQQDSAFFDQLWNVVSLAHTCDCYDLHRVSQLNNIWKLVEKRTVLLFLKKVRSSHIRAFEYDCPIFNIQLTVPLNWMRHSWMQ